MVGHFQFPDPRLLIADVSFTAAINQPVVTERMWMFNIRRSVGGHRLESNPVSIQLGLFICQYQLL